MNSASFLQGMNKLGKRWPKVAILQGTLDLYFEKLEPIPPEAWDDIVEHVLDRFKSMPTRGELWDMWGDWKGANPGKMIRDPKDKQWCAECDGLGWFALWYIPRWIPETMRDWNNPNCIYETAIKCARCDNWSITGGNPARRTKAQVIAEKGDRIRLERPECLNWHIRPKDMKTQEDIPF